MPDIDEQEDEGAHPELDAELLELYEVLEWEGKVEPATDTEG